MTHRNHSRENFPGPWLGAILLAVGGFFAEAEPEFPGFRDPPHEYLKRNPTDRFTQIKDDLQAGKIAFDYTSEKAYLLSLLRGLGISPHTQMLVFSTTSLQLSRISPENPRAV
ncbi:MAG: hypothetical protein AAEJ57_01240, partial [Opitutales bacterium]